jgi:hypothetical protein
MATAARQPAPAPGPAFAATTCELLHARLTACRADLLASIDGSQNSFEVQAELHALELLT